MKKLIFCQILPYFLLDQCYQISNLAKSRVKSQKSRLFLAKIKKYSKVLTFEKTKFCFLNRKTIVLQKQAVVGLSSGHVF